MCSFFEHFASVIHCSLLVMFMQAASMRVQGCIDCVLQLLSQRILSLDAGHLYHHGSTQIQDLWCHVPTSRPLSILCTIRYGVSHVSCILKQTHECIQWHATHLLCNAGRCPQCAHTRILMQHTAPSPASTVKAPAPTPPAPKPAAATPSPAKSPSEASKPAPPASPKPAPTGVPKPPPMPAPSTNANTPTASKAAAAVPVATNGSSKSPAPGRSRAPGNSSAEAAKKRAEARQAKEPLRTKNGTSSSNASNQQTDAGASSSSSGAGRTGELTGGQLCLCTWAHNVVTLCLLQRTCLLHLCNVSRCCYVAYQHKTTQAGRQIAFASSAWCIRTAQAQRMHVTVCMQNTKHIL